MDASGLSDLKAWYCKEGGATKISLASDACSMAGAWSGQAWLAIGGTVASVANMIGSNVACKEISMSTLYEALKTPSTATTIAGAAAKSTYAGRLFSFSASGLDAILSHIGH